MNMFSKNSRKLTSLLTGPDTIANALDWKRLNGSILTLDIGHKCIGIALASHPLYQEPVKKLKSYNIKIGNCRKINNELKPVARRATSNFIRELDTIVKERNVCGFVVNWPIQKEGRCGAPCGRVLYTLELILSDQSTSIFTPTRRLCLWDSNQIPLSDGEDEWGRCPIYGEPLPADSTKTHHRASIEQYAHECSSTTAANIWKNYSQVYWPNDVKEKEEHDEESDNVAVTGEFDVSRYASSSYDREWVHLYQENVGSMPAAL